MNTIDRFSSASTSEASFRNRDSVDTGFAMSDGRQSSISSVQATGGGTSNHEDAYPTDPSFCSEGRHSTDDLDFLELSDEPPTPEQLEEAADIPIIDAEGTARPFRSLYQGPEHQGQRQLLIFIRHFYCGVCQAYIKRLNEIVTPSAYFSLPIPTTITVIGMGAPNLIPAHSTRTHNPFRMYTDPTRRIYKLFGMSRTMKLGRKPEYMPDHAPAMTYKAFEQMIKAGRKDGLAGGPMLQVGGEFLFEDGEPVWCHRMRTIRGHADFKTLARVLNLEYAEQEDPTPAPEQKNRKKAISKITTVEDARPNGLQLVYEDQAVEGRAPRARLGRQNHEVQ